MFSGHQTRSGPHTRHLAKRQFFYKQPGTSSSVADKDASGDSGSDESDDGEPLQHRLSLVQAAMIAKAFEPEEVQGVFVFKK